MEEELLKLDVEKLQKLLSVETRKFLNALQTGAAENELIPKRTVLTAISAALDKKMLNDQLNEQEQLA